MPLSTYQPRLTGGGAGRLGSSASSARAASVIRYGAGIAAAAAAENKEMPTRGTRTETEETLLRRRENMGWIHTQVLTSTQPQPPETFGM